MYQNQQPNLEADVVIQKIEAVFINGSQKIILITDKGKFSFFDRKKDGNPTKAMTQFNQFKFKNGDPIRVSYTQTQSGMNTHTGQPFTNNNVMFFVTRDANTPATHTPPPTYPVQMNGNIGQPVQPISRWNAPVNQEITYHETPVYESRDEILYQDIPTPGYDEKDEKIMDLTLRVQALEDSLKKTIQVVSGHGTLLTNLRGETAVDLHTSFPATDVQKPFVTPATEPAIGIADVINHFNPND